MLGKSLNQFNGHVNCTLNISFVTALPFKDVLLSGDTKL